MPGTIKAGVLTGDDLLALMNDARSKGYAIPAVNVTRYAAAKRRAKKMPEEGGGGRI